jgi:hypothetical protein
VLTIDRAAGGSAVAVSPPGTFVVVGEDHRTRRALAKEGRLYLLALVCATGGSLAVYLSDRLAVGILVFLCCVLVFGPVLYAYEKRRRK